MKSSFEELGSSGLGELCQLADAISLVVLRFHFGVIRLTRFMHSVF